MPKYRKKSVVVEAHRWFLTNPHPAVQRWEYGPLDARCKSCGDLMRSHGVIETLKGRLIVCRKTRAPHEEAKRKPSTVVDLWLAASGHKLKPGSLSPVIYL